MLHSNEEFMPTFLQGNRIKEMFRQNIRYDPIVGKKKDVKRRSPHTATGTTIPYNT